MHGSRSTPAKENRRKSFEVQSFHIPRCTHQCRSQTTQRRFLEQLCLPIEVKRKVNPVPRTNQVYLSKFFHHGYTETFSPIPDMIPQLPSTFKLLILPYLSRNNRLHSRRKEMKQIPRPIILIPPSKQ